MKEITLTIERFEELIAAERELLELKQAHNEKVINQLNVEQ